METAITPIVEILSATPMCFIATVDENQPRVRPFQFQFEQDGKLWFCTAKSKDFFAQIQKNPKVEVSAVKEDMTTLRFSGEFNVEDCRKIKERILAEQPLIKSIYKSADNPDFMSLYINHGDYVIFDFSGNPPKTGSF